MSAVLAERVRLNGSALSIQRESLKIALRNARDSVALMLLSNLLAGAMGWIYANPWISAGVIFLGTLNSFWRYKIARRLGPDENWNEHRIEKTILAMEVNSAFSGAIWATITLLLYPKFSVSAGTAYLIIVLGSLAVANTFMSMLGRSLILLTIFHLGSMVIEKLIYQDPTIWVFLVLFPAFGVVIVRSGIAFRDTALLAIRNGQEAAIAEDESRTARESAERANDAKSVFLATMSHELRTPLFGITGSTSMLLERPRPSSERDVIRTIDQSANHLLGLLNQILQVVQVGGNRLPVQPATVDAAQLISETVNAHSALAASKGISLQCDIHSATPIMMWTDPQRLRQIIFNLVGNSLKFTPRGEVRITVTVTADNLFMEVSDTGSGIAPSVLSQIFEPFNQGASTKGWERQHGLGLGLSITRGICEALGGHISATSQLKVGSKFMVRLPLSGERTPVQGVDSGHGDLNPMQESIWPGMIPISPTERNGGHDAGDSAVEGEIADALVNVLVIDDAQVNRLVAERILVSDGYRVTQASSAIAGLQELACRSFGVVLLDLEMPAMSGLQLIEVFRRIGPQRIEPAWVMLTGHNDDQARLAAKAIGVTAFLGKPVNHTALLSAVRKAAMYGRGVAKQAALSASVMRRHTSDGMAFFERIVKAYSRDAPSHLVTLVAAVESSDIAQTRREIHALRSISAEIGDIATSAVCKEFTERIGGMTGLVSGASGPRGPSDPQLMELAAGFVERLKLTVPDGVDSLRFYVSVKHLENSGAAA